MPAPSCPSRPASAPSPAPACTSAPEIEMAASLRCSRQVTAVKLSPARARRMLSRAPERAGASQLAPRHRRRACAAAYTHAHAHAHARARARAHAHAHARAHARAHMHVEYTRFPRTLYASYIYGRPTCSLASSAATMSSTDMASPSFSAS
eukprot:scaffold29266_cov41-Phaeocystis_antarctica.AAC.1